MSKTVISQWNETPTVLRMTRRGDDFVLEFVEGIRGTATERVTMPWKDFLADVERLK